MVNFVTKFKSDINKHASAWSPFVPFKEYILTLEGFVKTVLVLVVMQSGNSGRGISKKWEYLWIKQQILLL